MARDQFSVRSNIVAPPVSHTAVWPVSCPLILKISVSPLKEVEPCWLARTEYPPLEDIATPIGASKWAIQTVTSVPFGAGSPSMVTVPTNTWGGLLLSRTGNGVGAGLGVGGGIGVNVEVGTSVGVGVGTGVGVAVGTGTGTGTGTAVGVLVGRGVGGVVVRLTPEAHADKTNNSDTSKIMVLVGFI